MVQKSGGRSLYPVFARATLLAARSDFLRVQTAIETLTALGLPAAALTPQGGVVLANPTFAIATHVWTTRLRDHIALDDHVAARILADELLNLQ